MSFCHLQKCTSATKHIQRETPSAQFRLSNLKVTLNKCDSFYCKKTYSTASRCSQREGPCYESTKHASQRHVFVLDATQSEKTSLSRYTVHSYVLINSNKFLTVLSGHPVLTSQRMFIITGTRRLCDPSVSPAVECRLDALFSDSWPVFGVKCD